MLDFVTVISGRVLRSKLALAEIEFPCSSQVGLDLLSRSMNGAEAEQQGGESCEGYAMADR